MTHRPRVTKIVGQTEKEMWPDPAPPGETAATPHEQLVRAAQSGQFEVLVAQAQLTEPIAMVTPEEREAELRAAGKWPQDEPKAAPPPEPQPEEPKEPEREPTPGELYAAEHCFWRPRGRSRPNVPYGRCITEYDVITGEIIGDGYDHSYDEEE